MRVISLHPGERSDHVVGRMVRPTAAAITQKEKTVGAGLFWEGTVLLGYDGQGRCGRRTVSGGSRREILDKMACLRGRPLKPAEAAWITVAELVGHLACVWP